MNVVHAFAATLVQSNKQYGQEVKVEIYMRELFKIKVYFQRRCLPIFLLSASICVLLKFRKQYSIVVPCDKISSRILCT